MVTALLLGSGLMNMISPTNGLLLAFLAASKVNYLEWTRFVAPLVAIYLPHCPIFAIPAGLLEVLRPPLKAVTRVHQALLAFKRHY